MNLAPSPSPHQPAGAPHRARLLLLAGAMALGYGAMSFAALPAAAQANTLAKLPAVVVWDFDNQSPGALPGALAGGADFLKRSLGENLTAQLLAVPGLPVVERQRLKDVLAEQKVSAGELADDDTRVRLGKIVGAQRMVFGGFFVLGEQVQVNVRVIDTATARVIFAEESTGPVEAVMQQVQPLNRRVVRALSGAGAGAGAGASADPSAPLPRQHDSRIWQAYDRALALGDAGQFDAAIAALQALLAQHKDFSPAERQLVALLDKMARR